MKNVNVTAIVFLILFAGLCYSAIQFERESAIQSVECVRGGGDWDVAEDRCRGQQ